MKKTIAKIISILIIMTLCMPNSLIYALTEKEELEKEQSKINDQIEDALKKQDELEKQKSATMKSVEDLIGKVSDAEREEDKLKSKINNLKGQIEAKEKDIQQKQEEYIEQDKLLNARLIAMYEGGETSYLEVLLTSASMTDFLGKYYAASQLIEYDKKLMRTTQEQKAQIEAEKLELENNKAELDQAHAEAERKSAELQNLKKEKEKQAQKLTSEEKEIQKEIEALERDNREIERKIKEAEERYRKELEELEKNEGAGGGSAGKGFFMRPVSGGYESAGAYYKKSGKFHGAIDYAVSPGTPIYAAATGVVMTTADLSGSYGTYVVIRHANGLQSYYAHGTRGSIVVKPGQTVKKGQKIMSSGNTGNSQGPHLHFEVRKSPYKYSHSAKAYGQDSRVNPKNYM